MKLFLTIIIFLTYSINVSAQISTNEFTGNWIVNLKPTPESENYFKDFEVKNIKKNTFKGTFYGSKIKNGIINTNWDRIYFSFTTSDQSNDYYHSGYILNGKVFGISYCPNRNFTAPWTGDKK